MELTINQRMLLMQLQAGLVSKEDQAIILTILNEEETDAMVQWGIDYFVKYNAIPNEQDVMHKLSEILPTQR